MPPLMLPRPQRFRGRQTSFQGRVIVRLIDQGIGGDDSLAIDGFGIEYCLLRPRHAEDFDVLANSRRARRRRRAGTGCKWENDAIKLPRPVALFPRCPFCANAQ